MPEKKLNIVTPSIAFVDEKKPPKVANEHGEMIEEYEGEEEGENFDFLPDQAVSNFFEELQQPNNSFGYSSVSKEKKYVGVYSSVSTDIEGSSHSKDIKEILSKKAKKTFSGFYLSKKRDALHSHVFRDHFIDPCGIIAPHTAFGSLAVNDANSNIQFMIQLNKLFTKVYARRAFVHWGVGEGLEESEYRCAQDLVENAITAYKAC